MIKSSTCSDPSSGAIELTPLIDIVFIVVVFLLATSNAPVMQIDVDLPSDQQGLSVVADASEPVVIGLKDSPPRWWIDAQSFATYTEFESQLLAHVTSTTPTQLAIDREVPSEHLIQLISLLQHHQISNVGLLMSPQNSDSE
ncbi:ExbD/TolR family protein [Echinimonas agarilytica]|uniref:Biopolymer transporter ExbD n=1 Tax=Echinimonas agarilytica TaxID=1215918 RepID=A0AA42B786_9GAMM|nr:biopolymer transporter ExbD [Echinimonas agarilytica]MCM2679600.1 biopolymer transporter ExbD [Echinimonas agarilytica]